MIGKIGVLCQDRNSFGFLEGIKRRLGCEARLLEPETGGLAKSSMMTRSQARIAVRGFERKGVDLIVRFTDADKRSWQDVKRHEREMFPDEWQSMLVCAVADRNTEQWMGLDRNYVADALESAVLQSVPADQLTDIVKSALAQTRGPDEPSSEVAARFVADAPAEVFRMWLSQSDSLRAFYEDCRLAAIRDECDVPNELDQP